MLKPLKNKFIVEPVSIYGRTPGGIYFVGGSKKEVHLKAKVLYTSGSGINANDIVYMRRYAWKPFKYQDKVLLSIELDKILAVETNGEFRAVKDMVLVKMRYQEKIGSIIVPGTRKQYRADFLGECISAGPEYKYGLKKGDMVYITRMEDGSHEGFSIDMPSGKLWSIKSKWVMAFKPKGEV